MSFIDGVVLTVINTAGCLALPKLLSIIVAAKEKTKTKSPALPTPITSEESVGSEVPIFP